MRLERLAVLLLAGITLLLSACGGDTRVRPDSKASSRTEAARVHTELGQTYMSQGQLRLALEKLEKALLYDPSYVDAHTVIAVLYETINDQKKAGEHYRRAAQLKPRSGAEQNNYGTWLCSMGQFSEAQQHFDRALADPFYDTPASALINSASCQLKTGRVEEAEQALRTILEHAPERVDALFLMASVLYEKQDFMGARAFMQRFESTSAPQAESLFLARNIELRLGNGAGASEYTRKLLQLFPKSAQARSLQAMSPP